MTLRLVLPDVHFPFQDNRLLSQWLSYMRQVQPDGIDILGDVMDCYTLSRFDKNPLRKTNIQEELDMAREFLEDVRNQSPDGCDIRFSEGNHENRLKRVLWGRSKELAPIRGLTIPELLDLKRLHIKYYTPETPYRIGGPNGLWYLHGDLARKCNWSMTAGGMGAKAVVQRVRGNIIMGHTHQMGHISFRGWDGLTEGYEVGCLCKFDMEYLVGVPQWQQGWAVVKYPKKGGFEVNFIRVLDRGKKRLVMADGDVFATLPPAKRHI